MIWSTGDPADLREDCSAVGGGRSRRDDLRLTGHDWLRGGRSQRSARSSLAPALAAIAQARSYCGPSAPGLAWDGGERVLSPAWDHSGRAGGGGKDWPGGPD